MASDRIDFSRNGKKVFLGEGNGYKKAKKVLKSLEPIFNEIDKVGNKAGNVDGNETELLKLLRGKLGKYISEDEMQKLAKEFLDSGLSIEEFLKNETKTEAVEHSEPVQKAEETPATTVEQPETSPKADKVETPKTEETTPAEDKTSDKDKVADDKKSSRKAFNDMIQNLVMKIAKDKEALTAAYGQTYTIQKGDSFYKIAERSLKAEGKKATPYEVNKRIAEIALVNDIKDIYKVIRPGDTIKIKGAASKSEPDKTVVDGQEGTSAGVQKDDKTPENKVEEEDTSEQNVDEKEVTVVEKSFDVVKSEVDETWTEVAVEGETNIKKRTKTVGEGENAVTTERFVYSASGVTLEAGTLEELKRIKEPFDKEIKSAPENETEEAATARKAENLKTLVERVKAYPSEEVLKDVVAKLKDSTLVDKSSDDFKALVKSLLLTKNFEVVTDMIAKSGEQGWEVDNTLFEADEEALKTVAALYKELVEKENAGEKLTDEEHYLKSWLNKYRVGYSIPADADHGVVAKRECYTERGVLYSAEGYNSDSAQLLDEFITKLKAADTDEKKAALFKEYANTDDIGLAHSLAKHADELKASKDDVLALVNKNDIVVISILKYTPAEEVKDEFNTAVKDRVLDIYLNSDVGNIKNAQCLYTAYIKLRNAGLSDEEVDSIMTKICETYFVVETTKDENGNEVKTYKFEPERRYKRYEMSGLAKFANDAMRKAIVDTVKVEDVGTGEYTEPLEQYDCGIVDKYAEFVDKMETKEEVLDFIRNKIAREDSIPCDKVLEKFPNDADIMKYLMVAITRCENPAISDENRVKLAKFFTQTDENGNVTFDKTKLPEHRSVVDFVEILPEDCTQGDAAKFANEIIKNLGKDDISVLARFTSRATEAVRNRLAQLVAEHKTDKEFIQVLLNLSGIKQALPYAELMKLNAVENEYDDETKQTLFENVIYGHNNLKTDQAKLLAKAVELGWAVKITDALYQIGNKMYDVSWYNYGADGKGNTADDIMVYAPISVDAFNRGLAMHGELRGFGSGEIADMLRGTDKYKDYVTKDSVVGILQGFRTNSPKEGIMEFIANEFWFSTGKKPKKDLCNKIPKALMQRAAELGLADTKEYKALKEFFGADDQLNFTKNNETKRYKPKEAKQLDIMMYNLLHKIECAELGS